MRAALQALAEPPMFDFSADERGGCCGGDRGAEPMAVDGPPFEWGGLPDAAALVVLHFLHGGHAKTARAVCRAWRDTLDAQARYATLPTWPGHPHAPHARPGWPAGPRRPLHVIAPQLECVDLSLLPPDEAGGRLAPLLDDLAQLPRCATALHRADCQSHNVCWLEALLAGQPSTADSHVQIRPLRLLLSCSTLAAHASWTAVACAPSSLHARSSTLNKLPPRLSSLLLSWSTLASRESSIAVGNRTDIKAFVHCNLPLPGYHRSC